MIRSTAVRLGIPVRQLTFRILVPFGLLLLGVVGLFSFLATNNLQDRAVFEQQITVKTLFETQASVHSSRNGLAVLSQNRGYERIWVLSATGDILDSNKSGEVGTQLDSRWWDVLKDEDSGFVQQLVDFGNQKLSLTALHHAEMGRWVVVVSKPTSTLTLTALYSGLILIIGLILWLLTAGLIWGTLSRQVAIPLKKLDDRTVELIRGTKITDAALDRLLAETLPTLGGHADCVVDLARKAKIAQESNVEARNQFEQLFNNIPSVAIICSSDGKIVQANRSTGIKMGVETAWIEGQPINMLKGLAPVAHLEKWFSKTSSMKVGIERIELFPSSTDELNDPIILTIQPIALGRGQTYLVVIEEFRDLHDRKEGQQYEMDPSIQPAFQQQRHSPPNVAAANDIRISEERTTSSPEGELLSGKSTTGNSTTGKRDQPEAGPSGNRTIGVEPTESVFSLGDGAKGAPPIPPSAIGSSMAFMEGLMEATGQFVVVFDESAQTVFWSPSAREITGLKKADIAYMKSFTDRVFTSRQERKLFKTWIDGEPDERSQELKIKTPDGTLTSRWYASEVELEDGGSVGVLWAVLDTPFVRHRRSKREPVAR